MPARLYGIANCDSCRAARKWLSAAGVTHEFVDLRVQGVDRSRLQGWEQALGRELLINRRGRSWRELPGATREQLNAAPALDPAALELIQKRPLLIKRPVLEYTGGVTCGFSAPRYQQLLGSTG